MNYENISDIQRKVVPNANSQYQFNRSQNGHYNQMISSASDQTAATSMSNQSASYNPYYEYNQNKIHSVNSLYPTTTSESASIYPAKSRCWSVEPITSNKENKGQVATTQKAQNGTTEKLCYTIEQLDILNAIYNQIRYPNSVQKTIIANIIGINREQTKIWFQNRRRRDTMIAQGKRVSIPGLSKQKKRKWDDESEESINSHPTSSPVSVVDQTIVDAVLLRLRQHQNAPDRLSSKRVKRPKPYLNEKLEEEFNTELEPIVQVEQQSSKNQTPKFFQMQNPVAINDYMTQSYSDFQKYAIQYSQSQTHSWSSSQAYYYNQMNSYDHSSQQFQIHSNNASSQALQQYSSSTSSSFSSSSSFNYSNHF